MQEHDELYETMRWNEDINFYRPDGTTERKSIGWCKGNGFFRIEED